MWCARLLALAVLSFAVEASAEGLSAERLGVVFRLDDAASVQIASYYAEQRAIPAANVVGIRIPDENGLSPEAFSAIRSDLMNKLPAAVQSLLLVWSKPFAVGCMSVTTAFAAGYQAAFCQSRCERTLHNPLFDSDGWLPADTLGWWPAMLLPTADVALAQALIQRGKAADSIAPAGILYLIRTADSARNVRATTYAQAELLLKHRIPVKPLTTPVTSVIDNAMGYFTGAVRVEELPQIRFRPGALADHLTSAGGVLEGGRQMSALEWLQQGATATYGTVSEPCNFPEKFPDVRVLFDHYTHGESVLESYWKSVAMPGQGLFVGEPLARPYANRSP